MKSNVEYRVRQVPYLDLEYHLPTIRLRKRSDLHRRVFRKRGEVDEIPSEASEKAVVSRESERKKEEREVELE
jgi:hypothetical protein